MCDCINAAENVYRHQLVAGKMSLSDTISIAILNKTFSRHDYIVVAYIYRKCFGYGGGN